MATTVDTLILDLLDWIGPEERPYTEVIEACTSCPRLPVWEEANERGYVERRYDSRQGACIAISAHGRELLSDFPEARPRAASPPSRSQWMRTDIDRCFLFDASGGPADQDEASLLPWGSFQGLLRVDAFKV